MLRLIGLAVFSAVMGISSAVLAQIGEGWQTYQDPTYGFSAELPLGTFDVVSVDGIPGLALKQIDGNATINLHGGRAQGMTRDGLETHMEAGVNATTTYRAGGTSWFVLSGYYDGGQGEDTIYYTKVLFSPDRETFAAFEITFPASDKPRFEAMVEHFEDNFTRPGT